MHFQSSLNFPYNFFKGKKGDISKAAEKKILSGLWYGYTKDFNLRLKKKKSLRIFFE